MVVLTPSSAPSALPAPSALGALILALCVPVLCVSLLCVPLIAHGSGEDIVIDPRQKALEKRIQAQIDEAELILCDSTAEYIKALKFLRTTKEIIFPDRTARKIAEDVASGCNGAAERFAKILLLLKTVGLTDRASIKMALEFSLEPPEVQKNFSEIFTKAFLGEFFDYEYQVAANLAFELSRNYKGDPVQVRKDFIELARFCKDDKSLALPTRVCAEFAVKLARLSQYFKDGIRSPFYKLYKDLREKREFGLDLRTALDISYNVLKNGPRAPENFTTGYHFAISKEGLDLDRKQALAFGIRMADRSFVGDQPPIFPALPSGSEFDEAGGPSPPESAESSHAKTP